MGGKLPQDNPKQAQSFVTIRAALPEDAPAAAELIFMMGERIFKHLFYADKDKSIDAVSRLFQLEANEFTYQTAYIAEIKGEIGGLIHFVDQAEKAIHDRTMGKQVVGVIGLWSTIIRLPRFIQFGNMIPKIEEGMLYIQHLAAFKAFRQKGVATELLAFSERHAKQKKLSQLALDVVIDNISAIRLYEHFGFAKIQTMESKKIMKKYGFKGLYRMVKEI
jgi:ribosomal protein S18 acetylase RimI-like enzyme